MAGIPGIRYGRVVSVTDPDGGDRVKVRIFPDDNDKLDENLPFAFPGLPKFFYSKPKVGEGVFVQFAISDNAEAQRYYLGPVISQKHRMFYDRSREGGDTYQRGGRKGWDVNQEEGKEDTEGIFPNNDDIAIFGRKNSDIILKDDDIRIRAGVKITSDTDAYRVTFNEKCPSYIKLKYHTKPLDGENKSTATIVADKIFLFGNKSRDGRYGTVETTNRDDLVTDDELNRMLNDGFRLPYGEKLVTLLKSMINIFNTHTHAYPMLPPDANSIEALNLVSQEPLEEERLLSDTIRIN